MKIPNKNIRQVLSGDWPSAAPDYCLTLKVRLKSLVARSRN
jgi:hypothetical protein